MTAPATLMFDQIKIIFQNALQTVAPGAPVLIGQPTTWSADILGYFWYDDTSKRAKAGPSVIRYTHYFPMHVLVRGVNDEVIERLMSDIDAALFDGFANHRRLNGTSVDSDLFQAEGKKQTGPIYISHDDAEYRHRFWTLSAAEDRVYNFTNQ